MSCSVVVGYSVSETLLPPSSG